MILFRLILKEMVRKMNLSESLYKISYAVVATGGGIAFSALANLNGDKNDFMNLFWHDLVVGGYILAIAGAFVYFAARRESLGFACQSNIRLVIAAAISFQAQFYLVDAYQMYQEKVLYPLEQKVADTKGS